MSNGPCSESNVRSVLSPLVILAILAIVGAPLASAAQAPADIGLPSCASEFAWARDYAERNYAGYDFKLMPDVRPAYDSLVVTLAREAEDATDQAACSAILTRWTAFFRDGHLSLSRRGATVASPVQDDAPDAIRARYASAPRRPIGEGEARARLTQLGAARDPIEGIWEMQGGNYRGVVLRDEQDTTAFLMSILRADSVWWTPGQVKAIFAAASDGAYGVRFFMRDHSEQQWEGRVHGNVLTFSNGSPWLREWPVRPGDVTAAELAETANNAFKVRDLGSGTLVVHVPSFDNPRAIDSLFDAEGERVAAAERLIVDVRGNGGGSDHNFRMFLPLVYSGPIRMVHNAILVTDDNIAVNEALAADTTLPEAIRNGLRSNVKRMRETRTRWYEFEDYVIDDLPVLETPRRVDIIADRGCGSSCEQFLLAARQSSKVTIYGTRSAGVLDFGNVRQARMPGGTLVLHYPTTRSRRLPHNPVDGIGIQPDVGIPAGEADAVRWVLRRGR
jgi:hypothetical protein